MPNVLTFATDKKNNDLILDGIGNIKMAKDLDSLKNAIENAVRVQSGELQFNTASGVPYLETIFSQRSNVGLWKGYVEDVIKTFDEVLSIISFDIEFKNENTLLTYEVKIITTIGEVVLNG